MPHWGLLRSIASTQLMLRLAEEYGVPLQRCLAGTPITAAQLADPEREIPGVQELDVLRNILRALGPDVPFGLMAGLRYHLTTHGMWGFVQLSSDTGGEAIERALRYWDLTYSFNQLKLEVEGEVARFVYDSSANPDDLQAALVERDLGALAAHVLDIHGRQLPVRSLQLRGARPAYAAEFRTHFGVDATFGCQTDCLTFDAALLELRHPLADAVGLRISDEQCNRELEQSALRSGISGRVRQDILRQPDAVPTMDVMARRLGMTRRTLYNQLAREGTSYRELVEEIRATLAQELLVSSRLTIEEIAGRLGYAETSGFVAAFKRWMGGVSPGQYKRASSAAERPRTRKRPPAS